jgi:NADPH-ferrihemoprotein reductase
MIDTSDLIVLVLVAVATLAYFTKGKLWAVEAKTFGGYTNTKMNGTAGPAKTRNIVEKMEQTV